MKLPYEAQAKEKLYNNLATTATLVNVCLIVWMLSTAASWAYNLFV